MRYPDEIFWVRVDPKLAFGRKNRGIGHIRDIFIKNEKKQYNHVFILKIHVLANFHENRMIFDEIRGHLVILPFYRAQPRDCKCLLRKKGIEFEGGLLYTHQIFTQYV